MLSLVFHSLSRSWVAGRRLLWLAGLALFAFTQPGCMVVGVNYQAPGTSVPDAWTRSVSSETPNLDEWWRAFNDPVLNELIDRARESNPTLEAALESITEARAQRGVSVSQLFPQANFGADYVRSRVSESLDSPALPNNPSNLFASGFDAGWEVDVFGGLRRAVESAEANIGAQEENYRDVLVTLFSEVALNYIDLRTLEKRIEVGEANIKTQEGSAELTGNRFDGGLAPKIDVTQAETNLNISRALIPALRGQAVFARNRIATLTGNYAGSLDPLLARRYAQIPTPRKGYAAGLPADLIRARPDIRRAERNLAAQTALIGVAEADLYPRFSLFGDFSLQSAETGDFFDSRSRAYSFGPSMQWQIFSAGRIRNAIAIEESRTRQAYHAYESTVLAAVEEVETSMANIAYEWDRLAVLDAALSASRETVSLIKDNYENGLVNFQNVLDAERTQFNTEDSRVSSAGQIAKNYITLYKALGGGTETELIPPAPGSPEALAPSPGPDKATESDP